MSGTPKGNGLLQAAYIPRQDNEGYSSYLLDYTKTRALPDEAIARLRAGNRPEEFAQELECSFNAPNSGSYYGALMNEAERAGRITEVSYDPVTEGMDILGFRRRRRDGHLVLPDHRGGELRFIDYIEDSGAALDHYVRLLQERPYVYEMHLLPHDARVRNWAAGKARTETLHQPGCESRTRMCGRIVSRTGSMRCGWCCRGRGSMPSAAPAGIKALRQLSAGVGRGGADLALLPRA